MLHARLIFYMAGMPNYADKIFWQCMAAVQAVIPRSANDDPLSCVGMFPNGLPDYRE